MHLPQAPTVGARVSAARAEQAGQQGSATVALPGLDSHSTPAAGGHFSTQHAARTGVEELAAEGAVVEGGGEVKGAAAVGVREVGDGGAAVAQRLGEELRIAGLARRPEGLLEVPHEVLREVCVRFPRHLAVLLHACGGLETRTQLRHACGRGVDRGTCRCTGSGRMSTASRQQTVGSGVVFVCKYASITTVLCFVGHGLTAAWATWMSLHACSGLGTRTDMTRVQADVRSDTNWTRRQWLRVHRVSAADHGLLMCCMASLRVSLSRDTVLRIRGHGLTLLWATWMALAE